MQVYCMHNNCIASTILLCKQLSHIGNKWIGVMRDGTMLVCSELLFKNLSLLVLLLHYYRMKISITPLLQISLLSCE